MKFWNYTGNNLTPQTVCVFVREVLEPSLKVDEILAHDIVRSDLLCVGVVGKAPDNHIIGIGISFIGGQLVNDHMKVNTNRSPFWRGPTPSGSANSCLQVRDRIPEVANPLVYLEFAWSRAERPLHVLICWVHVLDEVGCGGTSAMNLFLIGETTEVFTIGAPCNKVCVART